MKLLQDLVSSRSCISAMSYLKALVQGVHVIVQHPGCGTAYYTCVSCHFNISTAVTLPILLPVLSPVTAFM
jgi:hypothetical protein